MELTSTLTSDRFGNSLFDVLIKESSGEVTKRTLSLEDYVNLIAGSTVIKKEKLSMLETNVPDGCFKIRLGERAENFDAAFFLPEEMVGAKILGNPLRFLQPRRVVFLSHREQGDNAYSRTNLRVYAVKDDKVTGKTSLFWYPLGHVEKDGHVCTGGACANIKLNSVEDAFKYFESFFTAESSGHYYNPDRTITEKLSYGAMMEALSNLEKFPYQWLTPASFKNVDAAWLDFVKVN